MKQAIVDKFIDTSKTGSPTLVPELCGFEQEESVGEEVILEPGAGNASNEFDRLMNNNKVTLTLMGPNGDVASPAAGSGGHSPLTLCREHASVDPTVALIWAKDASDLKTSIRAIPGGGEVDFDGPDSHILLGVARKLDQTKKVSRKARWKFASQRTRVNEVVEVTRNEANS